MRMTMLSIASPNRETRSVHACSYSSYVGYARVSGNGGKHSKSRCPEQGIICSVLCTDMVVRELVIRCLIFSVVIYRIFWIIFVHCAMDPVQDALTALGWSSEICKYFLEHAIDAATLLESVLKPIHGTWVNLVLDDTGLTREEYNDLVKEVCNSTEKAAAYAAEEAEQAAERAKKASEEAEEAVDEAEEALDEAKEAAKKANEAADETKEAARKAVETARKAVETVERAEEAASSRPSKRQR